MKRVTIYFGIASLAFAVGAIAATLWKTHSRQLPSAVALSRREDEQWPLTKQVVSRSLQTHAFRSDQLSRNSNDEIVWRWLKESIQKFPQNWIKLNISDDERYSVVLESPRQLDDSQLFYYNEELKKKGLHSLEKDKLYQSLTVYQGSIVCPNWSGLIDVDEAKLVYFAGASG